MLRKLLWLFALLPSLVLAQSPQVNLSQLAQQLNSGGKVPPSAIAPGFNATTGNLGLYAKTAAETSAGATIVNAEFAPGYAVRYGADPAGLSDSTAAISMADTVMAATCGTVTLSGGIYLTSASLPISTCVTYSGYGATIKYSGSGYAMSTAATGNATNCGIIGVTINLTSTNAGALRLGSTYRCNFRDIRIIGVDSTTNIAILMDTNTSGANNPAGNLNTAFDMLTNIIVEEITGTVLKLVGTSASNVVTLNNFVNFNNSGNVNGGASGGAVVAGIDFNQWCDTNEFAGQNHIGLNGNSSPANGVGLVFGDGGNGVYAETFQELAIDTFGTPATDNRQGIVANNAIVKFVVIGLLEYGPAGNVNPLANVGSLTSSYINQAPRGASNYQSIHYLGTNVGIGVQAATNTQLLLQNSGQSSGIQQFDIFAQTPGFNSGSPATVAGIASQPGLASSGSTYNVTSLMGFYAPTGTNGTNAASTNTYGYYDGGQTSGTNNFGYYTTENASGSTRWAFYGAGTAPSAFGGPITSIGGPFSVSGCGTAGSITGGATAGTFTVGTGATPCAFTITLPTAIHGWHCSAADVNKGLPLAPTGGSASTCIVSSAINGTNNAIATGDTIVFSALAF